MRFLADFLFFNVCFLPVSRSGGSFFFWFLIAVIVGVVVVVAVVVVAFLVVAVVVVVVIVERFWLPPCSLYVSCVVCGRAWTLLAIFTPPRTQLSRTTDRLQLIVAGIFSYQHSCRLHRFPANSPSVPPPPPPAPPTPPPALHFIYIAFFVLSSAFASLSLSLEVCLVSLPLTLLPSLTHSLPLYHSLPGDQLDFLSIFDSSNALLGRFLWESIWHSKRLVITVSCQTVRRCTLPAE